MMKTIDVDEDVYLLIMSHTTFRNESESSILRRLLGMSAPTLFAPVGAEPTQTELDVHLSSANFRYLKDAVSKFLSILGFIYQKNEKTFERVEAVRGRGRLYFALSAELLNESGRSLNPKQIPGSPYWVTTNTPTALKQEMLSATMKLFGYSVSEIQRARSALAS